MYVCVCIIVCVRERQCREVKEEGGDRKSQDQAVPLTEHSTGSSVDTAVHGEREEKEMAPKSALERDRMNPFPPEERLLGQ